MGVLHLWKPPCGAGWHFSCLLMRCFLLTVRGILVLFTLLEKTLWASLVPMSPGPVLDYVHHRRWKRCLCFEERPMTEDTGMSWFSMPNSFLPAFLATWTAQPLMWKIDHYQSPLPILLLFLFESLWHERCNGIYFLNLPLCKWSFQWENHRSTWWCSPNPLVWLPEGKLSSKP